MRTLLRSFLVAVLAAGALAVASPAQAASTPARIMPLGDSITWGAGSSTTSSYRAALWTTLVRQFGHGIDFVGSVQSGSLPDTDNEGHSGWRIDQIAASFNGWAATYQPTVVTLHIGTNDMNQNYQVATAPDRLGALIDQITTQLPQATVLVASIVPALDAAIQARINTFNAAVPGLVSARANAGKKVRFVNMATLGNADLADTLHPNDAGYAKMASIWASALAAVLTDGRDAPVFTSGFESGAGTFPGDTAPTWADTVAASMNVGGYCCALTAMEASPRQETAHGGTRALMYSGNDTSATQSYAYAQLFDVHIPVTSRTELSYWLYPQQANGTYTAVDLLFTDGTALRDSGVVDQFGVRVHPAFQGRGGRLALNQWNRVRASLAGVTGKIIDQIRVGYDQPAATGPFRGYLDDVTVGERFTAPPGEDLALRRTVTGSAACVATEPLTAAVDGTTAGNSKWCSGVVPAQLQVDLGRVATVRRVVVQHAGAGGESPSLNTPAFTIATSTDGSTWTTAAAVTGNVDSVTFHQLAAAVSARYVRLTIPGVARIFAFEVYGV
ncbi:lysophospholipase L1-like esterase [Allocatelliglobosispora scoriae]|uniref:Lysophospholipase L1-like esterase n=1 Tax=Allocatelliglobosispora scoriae TaxID=643052 RepID=A0A841BPU5_9ACTN|nr:GDSL-type esterase/lipase family protein [Allocatelliglobosispora scoriae]MBB5868772.1 lysophospholipase L1-like esterase [Allocatelliglobosispora scoriae]